MIFCWGPNSSLVCSPVKVPESQFFLMAVQVLRIEYEDAKYKARREAKVILA